MPKKSKLTTTAIILAGGAGRRMGNTDKAWLPYDGVPLIQHVIDIIEPQVTRILISYSRSKDKFSQLPFDLQADTETGFKGPLTAILGCIDRIKTERVLVIPCDAPLLPKNLVRRLAEPLLGHQVSIAFDGKRRQHLIFLAETQALDSIEYYLKNGGRSVAAWLDQQDNVVTDFSDENGAFINVNYPTQLAP